MKHTFSFLLAAVLFIGTTNAWAQKLGVINGTIKDKHTQELLPGVIVVAKGNETLSTQSDENGVFQIKAPVGKYTIEAMMMGYQTSYTYNIVLNSGNAQIISIELQEETSQLKEVVINQSRSVRATDMVTPLATQRLSAEEIKINPGGNFDVSKVIQVLPGVGGGTTPNRNDIVVRGGGPSENVYYLDGIEIPVLNHFQTQGASGGATGIVNVSFINDVQLTSSAFDSRYDNALAATIVIQQRNGNPDKLSGNFRLSGSEMALTTEGPLSKRTTFLASARRSYLQFLFSMLDLPIRPDYWDFQYKINHKLNKKTELNFIGIGAIDNFNMAVPKNADAENEYIIRANPLINQWNYTVGGTLKHLMQRGYYTVALSRNMFSNNATRYENNTTKSGATLFRLKSNEIENKLRVDVHQFVKGWKYSFGVEGQWVEYDANLMNTIAPAVLDSNHQTVRPAIVVSQQSAIQFFKWGAYGHASKYFFNNKLLLSGGIRTSMNSYTASGWNPLKTLSPRLSLAYYINDQWNLSASVGSYFKLPSYTALGYKDSSGVLVNQSLHYMNATHYTIGTQYIPRNDLRFTLEAFYKNYSHYPVSLTNGISFANIGTDYSAVGNDSYASIGKGRVYGVEMYAQQNFVKNIFYMVSATFVRSSFSGIDGRYHPSTWDYGYLLSTTLGYKFKRNIDLGLKYRIAGGQPYTPFDMAASTAMYMTTGKGVYDYSQLNSKRLPMFQQLDLRIDKKFNFRKTSLGLYLDFQNLLMYKTPNMPRFTFMRNEDNTGFATTDGQPLATDGSNAIPVVLTQRSANVVPTIGCVFEF